MSRTKHYFPFAIVLLFSIAWLFYNQSLLLAPVDTGDGLLHFFIAQGSWENPALFLDHWGKPLFILLSSSFAQLGYDGMFFFNVFVFIVTTIFGWDILKKRYVNSELALCFPLLLLLTYDYSRTISAGLTEPLFSLFLLMGIWFWLRSSYLSAAFVIGCLLFLRSEGQFTVLLFLALLIYVKQWKAILFLAIPYLTYSLIGLFAFHDFWWYFTQSPYSASNNTYGSGDYFHYLLSYKNYLGNHGLFLFLLSIPAIFVAFRTKKINFSLFGVILLSFGTFFGILATHSYFWGSGTHGSMGLTRIATQGLPSFLLVSLYFLGQYPFFNKGKLKFIGYVFTVGILVQLCFTPFLKKTIEPMEAMIQQIANNSYFALGNAPIITSNIYFAELLKRNPLKNTLPTTAILNRDMLVNQKVKFKKGTYFLWDNYAGPVELNVDYDLIANYPGMTVVKRVEKEGVEVFLFVYNGK